MPAKHVSPELHSLGAPDGHALAHVATASSHVDPQKLPVLWAVAGAATRHMEAATATVACTMDRFDEGMMTDNVLMTLE